MKTKHNKKRNTAFIYEALVREMSKAVVHQNSERKNKVVNILREHFSKGTLLNKELECYTALDEKDSVDDYTAEKIIHRAKQLYNSLDKKEIFSEQTALIKKINKNLGSDVFVNFVPNYRTLATIAQIFNDKTPVKTKVLMERQILENISKTTKSKEEIKPVDGLVLKSFSERYNEEYDYLLPEQKTLLSKYILSFGDNEVDFKLYLAEELKRIQEKVQNSVSLPEISSDTIMSENTQRVLDEIKSYNVASISQKQIKKILKLQNLVNEYQKDAPED
jgi:hypothetical protein